MASEIETRKIPKRKLQRQLGFGIMVGLLVVLALAFFTARSYRDIDHFISAALREEIDVARSYERFVDVWFELQETMVANLVDPTRKEALIPEELFNRFDKGLVRVGECVRDPGDRKTFQEVERLAGEYLRQMQELQRIIARRGGFARRESEKRLSARQGLSAKVDQLTEGFRRMTLDIAEALKAPDFQNTSANTSNLMVQISRIEKDLLMAETEVARYLNLKAEARIGTAPTEEQMQSAADRFQKRMQAILALVEHSIEETRNPICHRVLLSIRTRIADFRRSFRELRETLERPDLERIEIDDSVLAMTTSLAELRKKGGVLATQESERFWKRIQETSDRLLTRSRQDFNIAMIFLAMALVGGIYYLIVFPPRVSGPLTKLVGEVSHFKLGARVEPVPPCGTEEIDTLAEAFLTMSGRLNLQGDINRNYITALLHFSEVFRELHTSAENPMDPQAPLEKAINSFLEHLIQTLPGIDLVKVMQCRNTEADSKSKRDDDEGAGLTFVRLGDPQFSDRFRASGEFPAYAASTGIVNAQGDFGPPEVIPFEKGLTGCALKEFSPVQTPSASEQFFNKGYSLVTIADNPTLKNRDLELGLSGSLFIEPIPSSKPEAEDQVKPNLPAGFLFIYFLERYAVLPWQDINFIRIMSRHVSLAMEFHALQGDRLMKQKLDYQLRLAQAIQSNLLPQSAPDLAGLKIEHKNESAAEVGGDYYDFFPFGPDRLGIVIADASGKNVPAAILMTILKTTLSTLDLPNLSAAQVLSRANDIILRNITSDKFITAMYVIMNAETGMAELACAGHNPAILVSGWGPKLTMTEKSAPGLPLGITEFPYQSTTFQMQPEDLLLMYTDGVTEARNPMGEEFSLPRLKKFLTHRGIKNPVGALMDEIRSFSQSPDPNVKIAQHDDITAVSVEFSGRAT